jgi:hypothetical protein
MTILAPKLAFLDRFLPDETLYSWLGRYHLLSGNVSEDVSRTQLFGSNKAGRHFHVPSNLVDLAARTRLSLGAPAALAGKATALPYYIRFSTQDTVDRAMASIAYGSTTGLIQKVGIGQSGKHLPLPRRSCLSCMQQDKAEHGIAYWRRSHQLPGVHVCPIHGEPLVSVPLPKNQSRRSSYVWPEGDARSSGKQSVLGGVSRALRMTCGSTRAERLRTKH